MKVGGSDHLSFDGRRLILPTGFTASEATPDDGDVTISNGGSMPVLAPAPSGDTSGATDTANLQAAITSALEKGAKLITACDGQTPYYVNATLNILPPADSADGYAYMDWEHHGYPKDLSIVWVGANSGKVIHAEGWKRSYIDGVKIGITDGATGVIAWDIDVTVTNPSTSFLTWRNSFINLGTGTNNVGWRMGHTNGGAADISFLCWENCGVVGNNGSGSPVSGQYGWVDESQNGLDYYWFGGSGQFLDKCFTTVSTAGAGSANGNDAKFFYGFGTSHNTTDFEFSAPGSYLISGGRFEVGTTFLNVTSASNHISVTCQGVVLGTYTVGKVFNFLRPGTLILDGCYAYGSAYTSAFVTLNGFTGQGNLIVRGGAYRCSDPMWTVAGGTWNVEIDSVGILNASSQSTVQMTPRPKSADTTLRRGLGLVAENFPAVAASNVSILANQSLYFVAVGLLAGQTVTNVGWFQTAAGSSLTLLKTALADKTGKILAVSADSSAAPGSSNSYVALAMGTPYVVPNDDVYYLCVLAVGTTPPTLSRGQNQTGAGDEVPGSSVIRAGILASQSDFPAVGSSFTATGRSAICPYLFAS